MQTFLTCASLLLVDERPLKTSTNIEVYGRTPSDRFGGFNAMKSVFFRTHVCRQVISSFSAASSRISQPDRFGDVPERLLKYRCIVLLHDRQIIEQGPIHQERRRDDDTLLTAERRWIGERRRDGRPL